MKKTTVQFVCDECGNPLPTEFIKEQGRGGTQFRNAAYNTVLIPANQDCNIAVRVAVEVNIDYGPTYKELCPKCRVKWLRKALEKFERAAEEYQ